MQLIQNQKQAFPNWRNQKNLNYPANQNNTLMNYKPIKTLLANQAERNLITKPYSSELFSFGKYQDQQFQQSPQFQQNSKNQLPSQQSNEQYNTSLGSPHQNSNVIPSFNTKQNYKLFNIQQSNPHNNLNKQTQNPPLSINQQIVSKQITVPYIVQNNLYSQDQYNQKKQIYDDDEYIAPIINQKLKKMSQQDYNQIITFEIKSLYKMGKLLNSKDQYLPGILSIKTPEIDQKETAKRVGVDLICLIDRSLSMTGYKLEMVKKTLIILLDLLQNQDRFQLIAFNEEAERLIPLMCVTEKNKQYFKQKIAEIQANGGTRISSATQLAFQQLKQRNQRNNVTSIFLLSDGQDDEAIQDIQQQIKVISEVFTLHTFGFGEDHDAQMMTQICKFKNGSFYFVQEISLLDEFFADALGGLISVIADQIEIEILSKPNNSFLDISISKTYGSMWQKNGKVYNIQLPQFSLGQRKDFVFQLKLPKFEKRIEDYQRNVKVMEAQLKIKNPVTGETFIKSASLHLTLYNYDEEITQDEQDHEVISQYFRVKSSETIENARLACENDNFLLAQKLIDNMLVQIKQNKKIALQCNSIIKDLQQARQACQKQQYNEYGLNQMYQLISNNYLQTGVNSEFTIHGKQVQSLHPSSYSNSMQQQLVSYIQSKKHAQSAKY
ncbi:unnamed protein product [Paramecium sonneborni]|uniref:VWFA domain-containing protein n=1 Tax=Paramecium sonneborni TaxID=65129 RepID=A0A8S1PIJ1_9CILI|nr:unnamed protein product [Paramecium sonneborni]